MSDNNDVQSSLPPWFYELRQQQNLTKLSSIIQNNLNDDDDNDIHHSSIMIDKNEPDIKPVHQYGHNKQQSTTKSMIINANIDQNQDRTTESMNNNNDYNVYDKKLSIRVDDDNDNPDKYDENQKISSTTKLQHLNLCNQDKKFHQYSNDNEMEIKQSSKTMEKVFSNKNDCPLTLSIDINNEQCESVILSPSLLNENRRKFIQNLLQEQQQEPQQNSSSNVNSYDENFSKNDPKLSTNALNHYDEDNNIEQDYCESGHSKENGNNDYNNNKGKNLDDNDNESPPLSLRKYNQQKQKNEKIENIKVELWSKVEAIVKDEQPKQQQWRQPVVNNENFLRNNKKTDIDDIEKFIETVDVSSSPSPSSSSSSPLLPRQRSLPSTSKLLPLKVNSRSCHRDWYERPNEQHQHQQQQQKQQQSSSLSSLILQNSIKSISSITKIQFANLIRIDHQSCCVYNCDDYYDGDIVVIKNSTSANNNNNNNNNNNKFNYQNNDNGNCLCGNRFDYCQYHHHNHHYSKKISSTDTIIIDNIQNDLDYPKLAETNENYQCQNNQINNYIIQFDSFECNKCFLARNKTEPKNESNLRIIANNNDNEIVHLICLRLSFPKSIIENQEIQTPFSVVVQTNNDNLNNQFCNVNAETTTKTATTHRLQLDELFETFLSNNNDDNNRKHSIIKIINDKGCHSCHRQTFDENHSIRLPIDIFSTTIILCDKYSEHFITIPCVLTTIEIDKQPEKMVDEKSVTRVLNGNVMNGGGVSGHYHRNGSSNMNSNGKINYQRSHHTNGCMTINSKTSTANGFHNNNSSSTMINNKQRPSSVSSLLSNSDSSYYSSNDSNTNSSGSGQSTDWSLDTDGDSSSSGDYEYGPGIVHRLRHKFMTLSTKQHQNNQQNRLQKKCLSSVNVSTLIKRCTSLEELTFEQFKQQIQQQTMNKTTDIKQQESITAVNKRLINNNHCNNNHHQMVNGTKKKLLFMQQQQQQNLSQQQMSTTNGHYHQKQSQQQSNNLKKKSLPPPIVNKSFSTTNLNHRTTTSLYPTNVVQKFVENVQQNKLKKPPPPPPQRINSSLSTTTTKTLTNNGRLCNTSSSSTNHCQLSLMSNNSTSIASNIATATTTITSPAAILSSMNIQAEQQQKEIGSRQHPHDYLHTATTIKQNCFIQKNEISNNDNATSAATISSLNSGDGYMNGTAMTTTTATTALMSNDIDSSQTSTTTSLSSTSTTSNILLLSTPQPYIKRAKSVETLSLTTTLNKSAIDDDENGDDQELLNEIVDSESSTLSSLTLKEDEPILPTEIIDSFNHSQQQDNLNVDVGDNIQQRQVFIDDHNKKQTANAVKDLAMTSLKSNTSAITPATSSTLNLNPVADHNTSASQSTSCSNDNDDDVVDDGACGVVGDNVNKLVHEETRQLEQLEQQQKQSNVSNIVDNNNDCLHDIQQQQITNPSKPLEENLIKLTKIDNEQDIDILEKRNIRIQSPHQQQQQETTMTTSISTTSKTTTITTRSSSNELPKPDTVKTVKRIFEHQNNKSSSSLSPTSKINSNSNQSKSSSVINERKGIVSNKFSNTLASSTKISSINQNRSNTKTTVTKTNANKPAIASRQNLPQTIAKQRSTESTLNRNVNGTTINRSNGICTNIVGSSNRGSTNKSSTINGVSGGNKKHYPAPKPPKASDQQRLNDEKSIVTTELSSVISTQETISNNLINSAISDSLCNNNSQTKLSQTKDNSNPVFKDTSGFEDDNNNNNNDDENNKIDKINDNGVMAKQSDSNQKDDELFPVNGKQYDENKSVEIITEKIDNVVDLLVETQNEHSHSFSMNSKLQTNLKKPVANIRPFNSTTATVKNVQSKESVVDNNDSLKESSPISSNKKNYSHESSSIDEPIKTLKPSLLQQNRNSLTNGHHDSIDSSSSLSSSIAKSTLWSTNLKSSSTTTATNSIKSTTVQNGCSTMVFDFRSTKNIKPNIAIQPTPFGAKPIPKRLIKELVNGNGNHNQRSSVINNNNDNNTDDEDDSNYSGMTEIPPPCGIIFIGENMIISNGSLMIKRNKNLSVRFDNSIPSVFEYPMVEDDNNTNDDDNVDDGENERKTDESTKSMVSNLVNSLTKSDIKTPNSINATTAANGVLKKSLPTGNSNLASYKPSKMPGQSTFELGVTKTVPNIFNCSTQQESIDDNNDHCDSMGDFDSLRPIPIKPASIEDTVPFSRSATASDLLF